MIPSIVIVGNASFAAVDPWLYADAFAQLSTVKVSVVAVQLVALHLLRRSLDPTHMIAIGLVLLQRDDGVGLGGALPSQLECNVHGDRRNEDQREDWVTRGRHAADEHDGRRTGQD